MPVAANFISVYEHEWEINFTQCAPNGYLRYVDLCNLLQLTAAEHSIMGGLSFNDMQQHDQAWVLSRITVEIEALPKWQDKVTVRTWIENLQEAGSVRNMEMYLHGKKIIGATTYWAVFNTRLRKSEALALPHAHFDKFPDRHATINPAVRINLVHDAEPVAQRRVVLSDLDIVNHVNNVKYLEWCVDIMPPEMILERRITAFKMNFMRELHLGDMVEVRASGKQYSIARNGKVCFALEVDTA